MPASNVPFATFTALGFAAPSESQILAGRWEDLKAAISPRLNTKKLTTPQGQIASSETAIIGNVNATFLAMANGVDPAYADGRMQDAIGRLYELDEFPARPTSVFVDCRGATGTVIQSGFPIIAADQNVYVAASDATIPASGTIGVPFACAKTGRIACPPQTFRPGRLLNGLEVASNAAAGIVGDVVESRQEFRARMAASMSKNSSGTPAAIRGAILAIDGVIDAAVVDNPRSTPITVGGVIIEPNSVYVCVLGGSSEDIAYVLWSKLGHGCGMTGTTEVIVEDTNYSPPFPSYAIRFTTPSTVGIHFEVRLARGGAGIPETAEAQIHAAVLAAFAGADGGPRMRIGGTVYASRFYAAVSALGTWAQVEEIKVGLSAGSLSSSVAVRLDQVPSVSADDIVAVVV